MDIEERKKIGRRFAALLPANEYSQTKLAEELNIRQEEISNFAKGKMHPKNKSWKPLKKKFDEWDMAIDAGVEAATAEIKEEAESYNSNPISFSRTADSLERLVTFLRNPKPPAEEKEVVLHNVLSLSLDLMESIREALSLKNIEE